MSKHTELPWTIGGDGADIFGYGIEPNRSDCRHVADVQPNDSGLLGMEVVDVANAAFIVRACNNHYQLLEALKDLMGAVDDCKIPYSDKTAPLQDVYESAQEAIAQAEKEDE